MYKVIPNVFIPQIGVRLTLIRTETFQAQVAFPKQEPKPLAVAGLPRDVETFIKSALLIA